jgi:hypothetical protein
VAGVDPKSGLKGCVSAGFSTAFSGAVTFGANGLLTVGCGLSPSEGFEAAGVDPKSGVKGCVSAGFSTAFSGAVIFGANGLLAAPCPERFENGLPSAGGPAAGFVENIEAPLGLVSGEVCILSSAGEVICAVDCPNRAGFAGVLVFCCAPNPPNEGVDWFPVLNPPKLNPLVLDWVFPPNDVSTEKGLLDGADPNEVGPAPKLKDT